MPNFTLLSSFERYILVILHTIWNIIMIGPSIDIQVHAVSGKKDEANLDTDYNFSVLFYKYKVHWY